MTYTSKKSFLGRITQSNAYEVSFLAKTLGGPQ
jgi:hypothetical protein